MPEMQEHFPAMSLMALYLLYRAPFLSDTDARCGVLEPFFQPPLCHQHCDSGGELRKRALPTH